MSLNKIDKKNLIRILENSNSFIIFATGRAGTDFLQSCYDNHPQIASTSEKSEKFFNFINENYKILLDSKKLFATLMVKELLLSFAPYTNLIEDWQIKPTDNYRKANCQIFIEAFSYLLENKTIEELNNLYILKACILSFKFATSKNINEIKTIVIHLHNLNQLIHYKEFLDKEDLIILCSRNIFDIVASGVFHWHNYFEKNFEFDSLNNMKIYRNAYTRTAFDFEKLLNHKEYNIFITMLEKLSEKNYLNKINKKLNIEEFKIYPNSTVLGLPRRPDILSKNKTENTKGFNKKVVNRGSPIKRIGIIDSILISICNSNRIKKYKILPNSKFLKILVNSKLYIKIFIFFLFILIPTKIELYFFYRAPINLINLILCRELSFKEKTKQFSKIIFYFSKYPYELFLNRLIKIKSFIIDIDKKFIKEI